MSFFAFPYTSVLDVSANSLLGNNTGSSASAIALTDSQVRSLISVYSTTEVDTLFSGKANTSHTHAASDITSGTIAASLLGSGTADNTTYLRGDQTWATVTAGIGGSSGSTDNAVLRADGTGGATVQASSFVIPDNYTASPNATVNHASIQAIGATTNVSVSIVPKGSGSFSLQVPDGTTSGGNARGGFAVDLQSSRNSATQVASGYSAFLGPGENGQASGNYAVSLGGGAALGLNSVAIRGTASDLGALAMGGSSSASAANSIAAGFFAVASGQYSVALGTGVDADGEGSFGCGRESKARISGMFAFASKGYASGRGNKQMVMWVGRNSTTGTTPSELFFNGSSGRFTIPSGKVIFLNIMIMGVKNDGSAVATYQRQYALKNVAGTTSEIYAPVTIGSDNAASTSIAITADDTNDALGISVTGIAGETWRWEALVMGIEQIWTA